MVWRGVMNGQSQQQKQEGVGDEAAGWLLQIDSPDATEADWLSLELWLAAAPAHRDAFDRVERVQAELVAAAPELSRTFEAPGPRRSHRGRAAQARGRIWPAVGLAAAAAALVVFVAVRPDAPAPTQAFQTAKGENRVLNLADGSEVHLNSGSRLTVRMERDGRFLELAQGEAAFDVAPDAQRPFVIAVGERNVRVVGTEFDVLRHQGLLRVTVREGVVAVQPAQTRSPIEPVTLTAGQQFEHRQGAAIATVRAVDPEAAFAWRQGNLVYRDQPLSEVVEDLNRYLNTPIQAVGDAADLRFSGVLRLDSEEAVLRRLQAFLPVKIERGPQGVTLKARTSAS